MNEALLNATSATGDEVLHDEYPTPAAARRAGRKLVEAREAEYFRVFERKKGEDGEIVLTRQAPDTAHGLRFMVPRAFRAVLRPGMCGVRIPGHVGRWRVARRLAAVREGEDVELFDVVSEGFARCAHVPELVVDERRRVVCDIISAQARGMNLKDALYVKGYDLK